ncbi:MAG: hypothetical protein NVSMB9_00810 [Isosphaeraceae bacterium]
MVGWTLLLIIFSCLVDWLAHLDAGVRLILLLGILVFVGWRIYRDIVIALVARFADLDIALRIEKRWPGLNDRLASTVQFLALKPGDDRVGSRELREATIQQTLRETETIDFKDVLEPFLAWKALALAFGVLAFTILLVMIDPGLSKIASIRLFLPFGAEQWPRQTHLTLLKQETLFKVARGDPFSMSVAVGRGERLPPSARAEYRFANGEHVVQSLRSIEGGIFQGRIESVDQSFTFSVSAGDDTVSVRNIAVKVVPPPTIQELSVRLVPPSYTKLRPQALPPGISRIKAVEGTRVEVHAMANKPIEVATLRLGDHAAPSEATLDLSRTRIAKEFVVKESHPFWFDLLDMEGFRSRLSPRYEVQAVRDEAPRVVIEEPSIDRDVPSEATVPITFTINDDFGIQQARLVYKTSSGGSEAIEEVVLPLWDSGDSVDGEPVKSQRVHHEWNLSPLKLPVGSIITYYADSRDFDTIKGPNLGRSRQLRLRILSGEEIARQAEDAQRAIREDAEAILAIQNQARLPVEETLRTLSKMDQLDKPALENLKNAEIIQRQVGSRLTNKADGLEQKIKRFLDDLKNFKMSNPDAQKQMREMLAGVERIRQNHLEQAEQGLTHSSKILDERMKYAPPSSPPGPRNTLQTNEAERSKAEEINRSRSAEIRSREKSGKVPSVHGDLAGRSPPEGRPIDKTAQEQEPFDKTPKGEPNRAADLESRSPGSRLEAARKSLGETATNQIEISRELKRMLDGLSEFETYRNVVKEAQNLLKEHEQVMKQTAESADQSEMMGKAADRLSPKQKTELANVAARQANIGKGAQNLREKLGQMGKRLSESDPLGSSAMNEAEELLAKKGIQGKIAEAVEQLEKNQMETARGNQEQVRQELKDLVSMIQNRRERELARLVHELKKAETDLKTIRSRQTQNLKKTQAGRKIPDAQTRDKELKRLAKEQTALKEQLQTQLKRLAKLNAESAAKSAEKAAGKMGQAQKNLEQDQGEQAEQDEEDALADLENAQEQLKKKPGNAEEQLAMEQLAKMGDRLKSMAARQEKVVKDITEYENLRALKEGKLTISQRTGVRNLAGIQDGLKDETAELATLLEGAPVFALTLKRATEAMKMASERLLALKTDMPTQRAAHSASERFQQLINSLKPEKPMNGGPKQDGGEGGGGGAETEFLPRLNSRCSNPYRRRSMFALSILMSSGAAAQNCRRI